MSVAKFYEYINSVLSVLKSLGGSVRPSEVCTAIARKLELPDSLEERVKNGVSWFENGVGVLITCRDVQGNPSAPF